MLKYLYLCLNYINTTRKIMKKIGLLLVAVLAIVFTACEKEEEENNTYRAEYSDFHYGWKSFLEAEIKDDEISMIDFDYLDENGDRKSETTQEDYPMDPHPTVWVPEYESRLMNVDINNFSEVDVITGATGAWGEANALMEAVIDAYNNGDNTTQILISEE